MHWNHRGSSIAVPIKRMTALLAHKLKTQMANQPDHLG
jgi:hypothetical protein